MQPLAILFCLLTLQSPPIIDFLCHFLILVRYYGTVFYLVGYSTVQYRYLVTAFERLVTMVTSSCHTSAPTTCLNSSPSNSCKTIMYKSFHAAKHKYTGTSIYRSFEIFVLMLYITVNYFSVVSGWFPVFLGWTSTKQPTKCLAQGHNTVTLLAVSLELATQSKALQSLCAQNSYDPQSVTGIINGQINTGWCCSLSFFSDSVTLPT